jgi:aspartyl-tRNA(Asn)/glutamyl-tRNA(Gln) amidotransferase subunit C
MDREKIKKEGVRLLEDFSKQLEGLPETDETHYVVDTKNVWRKDGEPAPTKDFKKKLAKIAPKMEDGYVVAEKGV